MVRNSQQDPTQIIRLPASSRVATTATIIGCNTRATHHGLFTITSCRWYALSYCNTDRGLPDFLVMLVSFVLFFLPIPWACDQFSWPLSLQNAQFPFPDGKTSTSLPLLRPPHPPPPPSLLFSTMLEVDTRTKMNTLLWKCRLSKLRRYAMWAVARMVSH
jgi:hypothetical protein